MAGFNLTITNDTYLKPSEGQYKVVGGTPVQKGAVLTCDYLRRKDNHYILDEKSWLFVPHAKTDRRPRKCERTVSARSQRNNRYVPAASCLHTSYAVALDSLGIDTRKSDNKQFEDEIYEYMLKYGVKRGYHDDVARLISRIYKIKCVFKTNATYAEIRDHLALGIPVPISGQFTRSGHIICLTGFDHDKGLWFVNDPWGEYPKYSAFPNNILNTYSYSLINKVSYNGAESCWAHFIYP